MSDNTVDLTKVALCNECKEDLKKKKEPVNAITLQKTLEKAFAPLVDKIEALLQAFDEDDEETEDEEDGEPLQKK